MRVPVSGDSRRSNQLRWQNIPNIFKNQLSEIYELESMLYGIDYKAYTKRDRHVFETPLQDVIITKLMTKRAAAMPGESLVEYLGRSHKEADTNT
jgi:hypothetical protein